VVPTNICACFVQLGYYCHRSEICSKVPALFDGSPYNEPRTGERISMQYSLIEVIHSILDCQEIDPRPVNKICVSVAITHPKYPLPSVSPPSVPNHISRPRLSASSKVMPASCCSSMSLSRCFSHGFPCCVRYSSRVEYVIFLEFVCVVRLLHE
jgi:hypothetical protein